MSMQVMSQTLWNRDSDFDAMVNTALKTEFGTRYGEVREYFKQLSYYGCPEAIRGEEDLITEKCREKLTTAIQIIEDFNTVAAEEMANNNAHKYAWEKLEFLRQLYTSLLQYYLDVASAEGLDNCKKMLMMAKAGHYDGYLLEGMACPGGCVAGAGTIQPISKAAAAVKKYKEAAEQRNAMDSQYETALPALEEDE
jgi:hypothetical protein